MLELSAPESDVTIDNGKVTNNEGHENLTHAPTGGSLTTSVTASKNEVGANDAGHYDKYGSAEEHYQEQLPNLRDSGVPKELAAFD